MMGAGFMRDMANSYRNNRKILKGDPASTYNSFDREAYPVNLKKRTYKFKSSTPELSALIKNKLQQERQVRIRKLMVAGVVSIIIGSFIFIAIIKLFTMIL